MQRNKIPESELMLNEDGSVYHLHLKGQHVAKNVILVGDPGRVGQVVKFFESIEFETKNREFVAATGWYKGQRFTVLSTGIGTDNIDIVLNELDAAVNIDLDRRIPLEKRTRLNLVRIGTSGALHQDIPLDSYVLTAYGLGLDGLIYYYNYKYSDIEEGIIKELNNYLNWDLRLSRPYLVEASSNLIRSIGEGMIQGITVTATGFYGPQGRWLSLKPKNEAMHDLFRSFEYQGQRITNFEMETSALYGLGKMLGHRCCTCCVIIANRVTGEYSKNYRPVIDGLVELILNRLCQAQSPIH